MKLKYNIFKDLLSIQTFNYRKQNSKSKCTDSQNNTENTSKLQNNNFSLNAVYDVREDNDSNRCEYDLDTDIRNKNINSSRFEYVIDTIVINDSIDDQLYETENSNNVERNNNQCETEVTMPMVTGDKPRYEKNFFKYHFYNYVISSH